VSKVIAEGAWVLLGFFFRDPSLGGEELCQALCQCLGCALYYCDRTGIRPRFFERRICDDMKLSEGEFLLPSKSKDGQ
jgi:hypothetical protein